MATIAQPLTDQTNPPKQSPLNLTDGAIAKVREIMATQDPLPAGLRIGVVGGGCSGFQYSMSFENQAGMMDKVFKFDDLKVFVDATSLMYLNGCVVDYVETLEAALDEVASCRPSMICSRVGSRAPRLRNARAALSRAENQGSRRSRWGM